MPKIEVALTSQQLELLDRLCEERATTRPEAFAAFLEEVLAAGAQA